LRAALRRRVPFVAPVLFAMTPTPDSCFVTTSGFSQSAAHNATAGANFIASVYQFSVLCLAAEPYVSRSTEYQIA